MSLGEKQIYRDPFWGGFNIALLLGSNGCVPFRNDTLKMNTKIPSKCKSCSALENCIEDGVLVILLEAFCFTCLKIQILAV